MSTTTSPDGILIPATSDTDAWQTLMAAQAGTIQTALNTRQVHSYRPADATALAALSGTYTLQAGDKADQLDTGAQYRWSGSAWVLQALASGLNPMIPTSVSGTGVVLGAGGKVTCTATQSATINGIFTSTYENYVVYVNVPSGPASGSILLQLAAAGTVTSAANYDYQVFSSSGTTVTGAAGTAGTSWPISGTTAVALHDIELKFFRPQLAVATMLHQVVLSTGNPVVSGTSVYSMRGFLHRLTTAYDGIVITTSANATFTVRGYGYNNN